MEIEVRYQDPDGAPFFHFNILQQIFEAIVIGKTGMLVQLSMCKGVAHSCYPCTPAGPENFFHAAELV
ncbi:hypothetical protein LC1Nh_0175 [Candidatus Nanohalobium constans]|uniref:Uncharacterized protein n=1 Tax=Candidatus Nanohalobium constans TaxID=2565781 RepID=A0A5Q0UES2_9ARCH|nr:hypothetical protein LC1Nh_0175 [Candidatus Nanohalobium constans]